MTSADADELSTESAGLQNGVFTYFVVQAMADPTTDANQDGIVDADEGEDKDDDAETESD